ncbi:MAG: 1-acyl-sn-glycerol-3-phosphate acyltransferase [Acidimicrobiia bacterium]|nr:1-acyl-sn-glycerol-3-phosphate acyltransferase [Acidimicrobiia bacterium]
MITWLAHRLLTLFGWRFEGTLPDEPKFIVAGAPHTTNWDFILFLAALRHYDMKVTYLAKHSLFRWPFRYFFAAFGGIPVDRSRPGGVVAQVRDAFDDRDEMILVVAPEGTRGRTDFWRSGFIKIAEGVGVPVVFAAIDYPTKTVRLSGPVAYRGDLGEFMGQARDFFGRSQGLRPANGGPVRVREERAR